jgi:ABC-type multidrug transport system fused ATPase/permease subunit
MLIEMEKKMTKFERIKKTVEVESEKFDQGEKNESFGKEGRIEFKNYHLRYRPDTELVLQKLTFKIRAGEKIGIVGRTGAGKSTICLGLCRIIEADFGSIIIDGEDISNVELAHLRKNITIIPQEPTLFEGTLKFNLDPSGTASEEEILRLVKDAQLTKLLERDDLGLE